MFSSQYWRAGGRDYSSQKIGDADFRVGQVGKNRPPTQLEHVRFEPGPKTFRLRIVVALTLPGTTATALRAQDLVLME